MNTTDTSYFTKQEYIDPYEALGNAIILQAVADYKDATAYIKANLGKEIAGCHVIVCGGKAITPDQCMKYAYKIRKNVRKFFHSRWFSVLTGIDGKELFEQIKIEI